MTWNRKALALSLGLCSLISAATVAQSPKSDQTLVVEDATLDWILRSDVAALRPGVIRSIELRIGMEASPQNNVIGYLHDESAKLAVREAEIAANTQGGVEKAKAQRYQAAAVVARNQRLGEKGQQWVSPEEMQKSQAELKMADAMVVEANETLELAKAKMDSARQVVDEHIIRAPFPGVVFEEIKHAGESVNSNEAVVRLGNLDRLRVWAYIPVEYRQRVAAGCDIEIQPRLGDARTGTHPLEKMVFRGKITFVDPKIQPVSGSEVRVYADIDNPQHLLGPGMKTTMTIHLKPETATGLAGKAASAPPIAPASPTSVGARPVGLPRLPR